MSEKISKEIKMLGNYFIELEKIESGRCIKPGRLGKIVQESYFPSKDNPADDAS